MVAGAGLLAAALAWEWSRYLETPLRLPASGLDYELLKGGSLSSLSRDLADQGYLAHRRWLLLHARFSGRGSMVQAGEYHFPAGLTPAGLLDLLEQGQVRLRRLTILEGWTLAQALEAMHAKPGIRPLLAGLSPEEQAQKLGLDHLEGSLEGWFFPSTYHFQRGTSDIELLQLAHRKMWRTLHTLWRQRAPDLPYDTPYQALIMASLLEKESSASHEWPIIAGVLVRRLRMGMLLQVDSTIIYGLGPDFDMDLKRSHLRDAGNLHNTYRHPGLPPTPICLPGLGALAATMRPAPGDSLYFVSKGDGTHHFSATLEEHERAVRRYQLGEQ